jgi:signal transduction histidine kinase
MEAPLQDVRFDRDVVTQVIFNLVDNALKYARDAERREIEIACREHEDGVELSVRDYGPGVPEGDLARIFEPFFRREDELTRTTKGTGIGLALVMDLAHAMGAELAASNAEGGGLRVALLLRRSG